MESADIARLTKINEIEWEQYSEVGYSFEIHSMSEDPEVKLACTVEISNIYIEATANKNLRILKDFLDKKYDTNLSSNKDWLYVKEFRFLYKITNDEVVNEIQNLLEILEEYLTSQVSKRLK